MLSRALTFAAALALAAPAFGQIGSQVPTDGTDRNDGREGYGREGVDARQERDRTETGAAARQDDARAARRGQAGQSVRPPGAADREMNRGGTNAPGDASAVPAAALAQWASQDNRAEIALARFAKEKSENPRVQRFAENMIQAHTQFGQKLDGLTGGPTGPGVGSEGPGAARRTSAFRGGVADPAPGADADLGADLDGDLDGDLDLTPDADVDLNPPADPSAIRNDDATEDAPLASRRDASALPADETVGTDIELDAADDADLAADGLGAPLNARTAARPVAPAGGMTGTATAADVLAFRQNLKKQCGETLKENFDKLTPNDFDKAYASQQIGAHLAMIDTLTLAERQARTQGNDEAAQVFAAGKRETTQHLTMAIALLNEVTPANVN